MSYIRDTLDRFNLREINNNIRRDLNARRRVQNRQNNSTNVSNNSNTFTPNRPIPPKKGRSFKLAAKQTFNPEWSFVLTTIDSDIDPDLGDIIRFYRTSEFLNGQRVYQSYKVNGNRWYLTTIDGNTVVIDNLNNPVIYFRGVGKLESLDPNSWVPFVSGVSTGSYYVGPDSQYIELSGEETETQFNGVWVYSVDDSNGYPKYFKGGAGIQRSTSTSPTGVSPFWAIVDGDGFPYLFSTSDGNSPVGLSWEDNLGNPSNISFSEYTFEN